VEYTIHSYVCFAEGFAELGIKSYSTYDHCPLNVAGDDYLIRHDEGHPMENADVVFVHCSVYQLIDKNSTRTADNLLMMMNRNSRKYRTVFPGSLSISGQNISYGIM
jgi:hypothetical protein